MTNDSIHIRGLELPVRIGVPDEERASWQTLTADVKVVLARSFGTMEDDLSETLDYDGLAKSIKELAASRPRLLLEVLAAEIMDLLMSDGKVRSGAVELRKRILPGVDHVAVSMERTRS
jgi:dihydroneopterin aldolase